MSITKSPALEAFQKAEMKIQDEKTNRRAAKVGSFLSIGVGAVAASVVASVTSSHPSSIPLLGISFGALAVSPLGPALLLAYHTIRNEVIPNNEKTMEEAYAEMLPSEKERLKDELNGTFPNPNIGYIRGLREKFLGMKDREQNTSTLSTTNKP